MLWMYATSSIPKKEFFCMEWRNTRTIHPFSWAGKKVYAFVLTCVCMYVCKIWGPDGSDYEDCYLLGCYAIESCRSLPTFKKDVLPSSSGSKIKSKFLSCMTYILSLEYYTLKRQ
jgi:hypothetical protein